ncbi:MAG: hypothetical protein KME31_25480 [Tolypothrix carrinoi HA7290-LM1]|nr:hypothetical protein [Tolypothrix carrinoi HA7290-LM1]
MGCTKHESFPHTPHPTPHTQERSDDNYFPFPLSPFPFPLSLMPNAQCPLPNAHCPMPNAHYLE